MLIGNDLNHLGWAKHPIFWDGIADKKNVVVTMRVKQCSGGAERF
jgi:hypothetical protein